MRSDFCHLLLRSFFGSKCVFNVRLVLQLVTLQSLFELLLLMTLSYKVPKGARNQHTNRSSEFWLKESYLLYVNDRRCLISLSRNKEQKRCQESLEKSSVHYSHPPHPSYFPAISRSRLSAHPVPQPIHDRPHAPQRILYTSVSSLMGT